MNKLTWLFIIIMLVITIGIVGAKPKPCSAFGCTGFCGNSLDCSMSCKCVGATPGNKDGVCKPWNDFR
jgi:hypothetical protein